MLDPGHYHFTGAAGTGMSALAQVALAAGCAVSASDRLRDSGCATAVVDQLANAGVRWFPQDGSGVSPRIRAVVASTAIESDNPDIAAARRQGIPVRRRGDVLAALVSEGTCVAVAGTSGKSTVTGMLGWILERAGRDPSVVNGAPLRDWMGPERIGNARIGQSGIWVVEADESDRSLLALHPRYAVITNISGDHFPEAEAQAVFRTFAGQVSGCVFGSYGVPCIPPDFDPQVNAQGSAFDIEGVRVTVPLPGLHNAENACCALGPALALGVSVAAAAAALTSFRGIARRLESVSREPAVIDDYAHNPAKIQAAWKAVAPYYKAVRAIWRPHGYGPLRAMFDALIVTFKALVQPCDRLYILPVYDAGGTADRRLSSETFVAALRAAGVPAIHVADYDAVCRAADLDAIPGCVWLTMGARDSGLPLLARRLAERLGVSHNEH